MPASLELARELASTYLVPIGLKLVVAATIFVAGRWLARWVAAGCDRLMSHSKIDLSLRKFACDLLYAVLLVAVVIACFDALGVQTTAVVTVLGAAGLAAGLALQGSLSNLAAGVMLLVLGPYKVGDVVILGKHAGRVAAIGVFHTVLVTADHRQVTVPNGQIIAAPIENLTHLGRRRLDLLVDVPHGTDLGRIRALLGEVLAAVPGVLADPAPVVEVAALREADVRLRVRPWSTALDHDAIAAGALERLKERLDAEGLRCAAQVEA